MVTFTPIRRTLDLKCDNSPGTGTAEPGDGDGEGEHRYNGYVEHHGSGHADVNFAEGANGVSVTKARTCLSPLWIGRGCRAVVSDGASS